MKFAPLKHIPSAFIAFVFIQSLFFKFSGSYETEHIFGTLGEWSGISWFGVYGGYLIGFAELIASILLFTRFHGVGAAMSAGIMTGAILFHLFTPLGVVMPEFNAMGEVIGNDGGLLFGMACIVWSCGLFLFVRDIKTQGSFTHKLLAQGA
ncbi:hypothetical protein L1D52_18405 [Vibrio brasiliensis]|jgi:hypothetical protein|uniref:hypothetical protein n=1 Tax=Vibrio brasiliensis TaxID=170652 RepID=UPI001EFC2DC2|nr:hypothetical protein [Vibrio brasiliensis]MCG9784327.1 hypothetical protein [Vibrio brasiliensis]